MPLWAVWAIFKSYYSYPIFFHHSCTDWDQRFVFWAFREKKKMNQQLWIIKYLVFFSHWERELKKKKRLIKSHIKQMNLCLYRHTVPLALAQHIQNRQRAMICTIQLFKSTPIPYNSIYLQFKRGFFLVWLVSPKHFRAVV